MPKLKNQKYDILSSYQTMWGLRIPFFLSFFCRKKNEEKSDKSDERLVFLLIATVSYAIPDGRVSILESVAHYSRDIAEEHVTAFVLLSMTKVRGGSLFS